MDHQTSRLLLYSDPARDSILSCLAQVFRDWEAGDRKKPLLVQDIHDQIRRLLDLSAAYGLTGNLWQDYLSYYVVSNENPFSLAWERRDAGEGSLNSLAEKDLDIILGLFRFDFSPIEADLEIDCFRAVCDYRPLAQSQRPDRRQAGERIHSLSRNLSRCETGRQALDRITDFYRRWGVGELGLNRAFRLTAEGLGAGLRPVTSTDGVTFADLVGYEGQKQQLRDNTEAFLQGYAANNVLLYGDSGTGKSTSVKALLNEYYDQGLRMIQIDKYQFRLLDRVIAAVKERNYCFIIFIDDLSFEENEVEYKYLKAVIEGGLEIMPRNVLLYATSNRRHLIREVWSDRSDMEHAGEVHRSDTLEEKLSLAGRFGVQINYSQPGREEYHAIVEALARRQGISVERERLLYLADRWELRHGGVSGRTARQFVNHLEGLKQVKE